MEKWSLRICCACSLFLSMITLVDHAVEASNIWLSLFWAVCAVPVLRMIVIVLRYGVR